MTEEIRAAETVIRLPERRHSLYPRIVKPVIDTVGSVVLLILTLPLIAAVAVASASRSVQASSTGKSGSAEVAVPS